MSVSMLILMFLSAFVADRVDHCVPVFKETVSFVHGMPAGFPASDAVPGDGDFTPILVPEIT